MPYVSHTHTLVQYTRSPTHFATVLTRSVCPSHVTVLLEAATACLLAFFRVQISTISHEKLCRLDARRFPGQSRVGNPFAGLSNTSPSPRPPPSARRNEFASKERKPPR